MWVKICANTSLKDATLAVEAGADAVGFVFAPSTRRVTAAQVAEILPQLPERVERVGVVQSHSLEEISEIVQTSGLTTLQLHSGFNVSVAEEEHLAERILSRFGDRLRLIQTLHWSVEGPAGGDPSAGRIAAQLERIAARGLVDRVLVDSNDGKALGGTGVAFDWARARRVFADAAKNVHLIVAGGLNPENVADAIAQINPWGVDVATGVEASPGRKNPARVARFVENARAALRQ